MTNSSNDHSEKAEQTQQTVSDARVAALEAEVAALEAQLGDRDATGIVNRHIRLLHTYNEIKDGAQALIGRYALATGSTVTRVHSEMGLSLTE